ncbi:unnamed protein product [Zymoseptoria tritici ST99CH_3D1]|nr:unnamed protein product [Zymoseptoria tritici ST99CH_3D1]
MPATSCPSLLSDEDLLDHIRLLESTLLPHFQAPRHNHGQPSMPKPTHLVLTHLLQPHRSRCVCCNTRRSRFQPQAPSFKAVDHLASLDLHRLSVMSQRKLARYLHPIVRDWTCRRCHHAETVSIEQRRVVLHWVRELRGVVAMLVRGEALRKGVHRPQLPPVDLTRTMPSSSSPSSSSSPPSHDRDEEMCCMICTSPIAPRAAKKTCFQCNNAVHKTCFEQYRDFEDLHQATTLTTEQAVLHLPCIYCRCIVLSVPRSEDGKVAWARRREEVERADWELASGLQESEDGEQEEVVDDGEVWAVQDSEREIDEWLFGVRE